MLYPSIQELLKKTEKDGKVRLNKYSLVMATAKCARMITNEYLRERQIAERMIANKETDRDLASLIKKEYRDEKAVKNVVWDLKNGEFEVFLPGEEGYEDSTVVVEQIPELPKEPERVEKNLFKSEKVDEEEVLDDGEDEDEEFDDRDDEQDDDFDSKELMGASEVFDDDNGYSVDENSDKE